jgi:hypothetical protein
MGQSCKLRPSSEQRELPFEDASTARSLRTNCFQRSSKWYQLTGWRDARLRGDEFRFMRRF